MDLLLLYACFRYDTTIRNTDQPTRTKINQEENDMRFGDVQDTRTKRNGQKKDSERKIVENRFDRVSLFGKEKRLANLGGVILPV